MIKAVFFDIDNTLYSYDRGNEAGIQPAREEGADGHIGDQLPPDGVRHQSADPLQGLGQGIYMFPVL